MKLSDISQEMESVFRDSLPSRVMRTSTPAEQHHSRAILTPKSEPPTKVLVCWGAVAAAPALPYDQDDSTRCCCLACEPEVTGAINPDHVYRLLKLMSKPGLPDSRALATLVRPHPDTTMMI